MKEKREPLKSFERIFLFSEKFFIYHYILYVPNASAFQQSHCAETAKLLVYFVCKCKWIIFLYPTTASNDKVISTIVGQGNCRCKSITRRFNELHLDSLVSKLVLTCKINR